MPCRPIDGFTLWTPGDKTRRSVDANPRIFYTLRSAQMARAAWVRAKYSDVGLLLMKAKRITGPEACWITMHNMRFELEIMMLHTSDWVVV